MVDRFSNHGPPDPYPRPPDWILTDLSPQEQALASIVEYQGVPIGHLAPTCEAAREWHASIEYGDASPELFRVVTDHLAEREQEYPDALAWDQVREVMAGAFSRAGRQDLAFEFLQSIRSPHYIVRALERMEEDQEGSRRLIRVFIEKLSNDNNPIKRNAFLRAYVDRLIEIDPTALEIDALENLLARFEPCFDPIESWIASQRAFRPEMPWNTMSGFLKMEEWSNTPLRVRQYAALRVEEMQRTLSVAPEPEVVLGFLEEWSELERQFPYASIWDQMKGGIAQKLLDGNKVELAVLAGTHMTNSKLQEALAVILINEGAEDQALELVRSMSSMKATAQALLDLPWTRVDGESTGVAELLRIIEDASGEFSIQQRVACLTVARVRSEQQGNKEAAARFQKKINKLLPASDL